MLESLLCTADDFDEDFFCKISLWSPSEIVDVTLESSSFSVAGCKLYLVWWCSLSLCRFFFSFSKSSSLFILSLVSVVEWKVPVPLLLWPLGVPEMFWRKLKEFWEHFDSISTPFKVPAPSLLSDRSISEYWERNRITVSCWKETIKILKT